MKFRKMSVPFAPQPGIFGRMESALCFRLIESLRNRLRNGKDQHLLSGLGESPSYRESKKMTKERQGPTLGGRLRDALAL